MSSTQKIDVDDLDELLNKTYTNRARTGYDNIDGFCVTNLYKKYVRDIENFEVRDDDVWVSSFPKSGSTWTQEMVWLLKNDLDFEGAKVPLPSRFPFLEYSTLFDFSLKEGGNSTEINSIEDAKNLPVPRTIKTHLPYQLLPKQLRDGAKKPRFIYVTRNPKDTCISYYHQSKLIGGYRGDFDNFCKIFLGGKLCYGPYWEHILGYWEKRTESNILFLRFEDMKSDILSVIKKTAAFLGKTNLPEDGLQKLVEHLNFANMKNNPAVNYTDMFDDLKKLVHSNEKGEFIRCGEVNQWKTRMSQVQIDQFDAITKQKLNKTNLMYC